MQMCIENSIVNVKQSMGGCPGMPNPGLHSRPVQTFFPAMECPDQVPAKWCQAPAEMTGKTTGGYLSGQKGATVNRPAYAYGGSNPSPPTRAVGQLAARLAHIQEVTGSSPVCATRPMQDGRRSAPPIPEPVWRKSRRTGLAGPGPLGRPGSYPGAGADRMRAVPAGMPESRFASLVEWQTRRLQVPVSSRTSGFKSRRRHGAVAVRPQRQNPSGIKP